MYWNANPYRSLNGMARLLDEMNRVFESESADRHSFPKVNAWSSDEGMILAVELPGVDPREVEVTMQDNKLVIAGDYPPRTADEKASYHRSERRGGRFSREITLPFRVDPAQVKAESLNGVVKILLPKPEEEKPRRIAVQVA